MNQDQIFRAVLIAGVLLVFGIGVYHRVRSQATREPLDRRQEGLFILITLRACGLALWVGLLSHLIHPAWMSWSAVSLPVWLRWAGSGVLAIAAALLLWTLRSLGKNLTDTVVTRQEHTLVIQGPYRWVRHPFYDSLALLVVGVSLLAANWFILAAGCALLGLLVLRTRAEEDRLVARFGDRYRDYMQRTGRFVPKR